MLDDDRVYIFPAQDSGGILCRIGEYRLNAQRMQFFAQIHPHIRRTHRQHPLCAQNGQRLFFFKRKLNPHSERRSDALFALHVDCAAHQADHLSGNRHAQTRAFDFVDASVLFTGKRLIERLDVFLRHADTGILHAINQPQTVFLVQRFFPQKHLYASARRRILDGVAQDIDEDLIEPELIGEKLFMQNILKPNIQPDILSARLRIDDIDEVFHLLGKREGCRAERKLPAFHLGDIQNIVDERQQMLARQQQLAQAFIDLFPVVQIALRDGRHAQNSVHRRADIMAHRRKESGFRCIGMLDRRQTLSQPLIQQQEIDRVDRNQQRKRQCRYKQQRPLNRRLRQCADLD